MGADDEPAETAGDSPDRTGINDPAQGAPPGPARRAPTPPGPSQRDRTRQDPASDVVPGTVLDSRYRLHELLGHGATAEVYRATDDLLGRAVAVKLFHRGISDPTTVARQRTEMQVLAKLHHPHLVTVYDAKLGVDHGKDPGRSNDDDLTYLVMELVQGGTLLNRITPTGMPPVDVARVGAAVAGALTAVHSYGLVHRDIKPANILISTAGDVKLSDFGIARELAAERLTSAADVIGTAAYLSPEQARGALVGPPTDVYALGLVLLESLTGHREYPGSAVESAVARLLRDPVVPANLPGSWPSLLRAMTQSDPGRRPTAAEVAAALTGRSDVTAAPPATATAPQPVPVLPPPPSPLPVRRSTSSTGRVFVITLLILAVTAGAIVGIVALLQNNTNNTPPATITPATSGPVAPSVITTTQVTTEVSTPATTPTVSSMPSTPTTPSTSTTSTTPAPTTTEPPTTTPTTPPTTTEPASTPATTTQSLIAPTTPDGTTPPAATS